MGSLLPSYRQWTKSQSITNNHWTITAVSVITSIIGAVAIALNSNWALSMHRFQEKLKTINLLLQLI